MKSPAGRSYSRTSSSAPKCTRGSAVTSSVGAGPAFTRPHPGYGYTLGIRGVQTGSEQKFALLQRRVLLDKAHFHEIACPPPARMPCTRLLAATTATRLPTSLSSSTMEVPGPALYTRPTSPSRPATAVPGAAPSRYPRASSNVSRPGVRPYARGQHTSPDHRPALRHLQTQQTAQTLQFSLRFTTGDEFLMQTRDFIPQTVILLLYINQRQVTFPYRTDAVAHSMHRAEHPPGNLPVRCSPPASPTAPCADSRYKCPETPAMPVQWL